MLGLPKVTELNKQLPKNAIYAKFQMSTAEKAKIDADISRITIVNEVSSAKVNIADGEQVKSFFVLLVALKKKDFDDKTIITISKLIPQNMLLVLECGGEAKLATYHTKLMQTDWKCKEDISIDYTGRIFVNDSESKIVNELTSGQSVKYEGDYVQIYSKGVISRLGNKLLKNEINDTRLIKN